MLVTMSAHAHVIATMYIVVIAVLVNWLVVYKR